MYKMLNGVTIKMTEEEIADYNASLPTDAEILAGKWQDVRTHRNYLLAECDWRAFSDVTLSDEWKTYRQALRDVPQQEGFPRSVNWPIAPSNG